MARARSPRRWTTMVVVALGVILGALSGATVAWALFSGGSASRRTASRQTHCPRARRQTRRRQRRAPTATRQDHLLQVSTRRATFRSPPAADYVLQRYPVRSGSAVAVTASCSVVRGRSPAPSRTLPMARGRTPTRPPGRRTGSGSRAPRAPSVTVDNTTPVASHPAVAATITYVTAHHLGEPRDGDAYRRAHRCRRHRGGLGGLLLLPEFCWVVHIEHAVDLDRLLLDRAELVSHLECPTAK